MQNEPRIINGIIQRIEQKGYVELEEFMEIYLSNYQNSYYRNKIAIGSQGDFVTAPEISQLFGEMIGIWLINCWISNFAQERITLVEMGAGKGTLMRDILLSTRMIPNFHDSLEIIFLDINDKLIYEQQKLAGQFSNIKFKWINNLLSLDSNQINIFIANEYLDALPVTQYVKQHNHWRKRIISLNKAFSLQFEAMDIERSKSDSFNQIYVNAREGSLIEIPEKATEQIKLVADIIAKNRGAALFIDYGYNVLPHLREDFNSSLQAIKSHKYVPMFDYIGDADLTSQVNFYELMQAAEARNVKVFDVITQQDFLYKMGIQIRKDLLIEKNPDLKDEILSGYNRLTNPLLMGKLFKVLAFADKNSNEIYPFV